MVYQYIERTAIPAWGPQQSDSLIAAGTVAGAMDATFSNSSELEIFRLASDDASAALQPIAKTQADARFQRLAWSATSADHPLGVLAGGLENGDITLWDPARIIAASENDAEQPSPVLHSSSAHTGAVGGLEFNPFQPNLMASGASNGEVFIWDIVSEFKSYSPGARSQRIESVTDLSWNNQVQHILATASNSGSLVVWDLRSRREVIALTSPGAIGAGASARAAISACVWNPASATQLVTASSDDNNPLIMLWDLRNANAPSQTFSGHQRGILSLSWCRKDAGLLLSSGKDNRTVCWNPLTAEIVGELPPSSNWVYDVQWNQSNPNLLSGASFDGRINLYSLAREADSIESSVAVSDDPFAPQSTSAFAPSLSLKRPPKWLARPCGAVFGFGGQLVRFSQASASMVSIDELVSEPELAQQAQQLEQLLQDDRAAEVCRERLEQSKGSDQERSWQVLQILFESDARDKLIRFLGFDKEEVKKRIAELIASRKAAEAENEMRAAVEEETAKEPVAEPETAEPADIDNPFSGSVSADADAEDFFSKPIEPSTPNMTADSTAATVGSTAPPSVIESAAEADIRTLRVAFSGAFHLYDKAKDIASEDADGLITRAVLLGDIEAAVELCIEKELFADALILATCGSAELASRAQQAYFAKRAKQASYVRLLHSIVTNDLTDVVSNGDLGEWDEILALLCTYAQGDRFSALCELLGRRLEQSGELNNAVLCYLASGNLDKVAAIWAANESTCVGQERVRKLHSLMEKVSVFRKAVQFIDPAVDPEYTGVYPLAPLYDGYIEYARFLASQGLIEIATKYLERVPASYKYYLPTGEDGLAVLRNRISCVGEAPWTVTPLGAPPQQQQQPAQQQKQQHQQPVQHQQQQQQSYAQQAYAPYPPQQSMPSVQHYQAPGMPMYPQPTNAGFSGMAQGYPAAQQQQQQSVQQQQQQQPTMFPPPPQPVNPASVPTGNTPPPRREEAAWNDPPMLNKPAKRAPASAVKPAAIISPFPQGRGTPPPPPAGMVPFSGARSPVGGAAAVPPPPPMSMGASMAKPLPPAPTQQMAFPAAQNAPTQQMMQPGFMPPAMNAPAQMGVGAQPMRGQVVSAASRSGTPAAGAASQQQQQQPAASAAPTKPASKYPEGDRSHLPSEWAGVFSGLNGHLQRAKQFAAPAQKRMVDDADRRLNLLFDLMNCDEVKMKDKLAPVFDQLVQAINSRQFPQALHCQAELMTMNSDITTHLVGVKHLINVLKTLPM